MNNLPNPLNQIVTVGVSTHQKFVDHMGDLWAEVIRQFKMQPSVCTDGGNDKSFFSFEFQGIKLFAAANEVNGLTIMLPEEY